MHLNNPPKKQTSTYIREDDYTDKPVLAGIRIQIKE